MSAWWQFRTLIRKNVLTLKRTIFLSIMEFFFPAFLMLICYLVKLVFNSIQIKWEKENGLEEYLIDKGNFGLDYSIYNSLMIKILSNSSSFTTKEFYEMNELGYGNSIWKYDDDLDITHDIPVLTLAGLPLKYLTMHCYERDTIVFIGFDIDSELGQIIRNYIGVEEIILQRKYKYKKYDSINELNDYVKGDDFGKKGNPLICFGIHFDDSEKVDHKYNKVRFD